MMAGQEALSEAAAREADLTIFNLTAELKQAE